MTRDPSTSGYSESAQALIGQYESISFEQVHGPVLHLFPAPPARVLDIGAGTGRDAAGLTRLGHEVTAVEPTPELRAYGQAVHPASIRWLDDMLPGLPQAGAESRQYDLVLLTAVWMHLDKGQREQAMRRITTLLAPGGVLSMTLRHGPVPEGRRMFDVGAAETVELGHACGLAPLCEMPKADMLGRADVRWSFLVLQKL